jgi:hypothetical protein
MILPKKSATFWDHALAAAFDAARLHLEGIQLIRLLQKANCRARASQKLVIDTRPDGRHGPVRGSFNIVARLDQNRIDPFETGTFLQGPQTDFLKLRGRPDLASYSFSGHCVSSAVVLNTSARTKVRPENPATRVGPAHEFRLWPGLFRGLGKDTPRRVTSIQLGGERDNGASVP